MQNIQNEEPKQTNILELNTYSFENVLDCLVLQDMVAVSQTCQKLQKFAQEYFKLTYKSSKVLSGANGLSIQNVRVDDFADQVKNIRIWIRGLDIFQTNTLASVENIDLRYVRLLPLALPTCFVKRIKTIKLHNCIISDDLYDSFLKVFENIERLHIQSETSNNSIIGANNGWLNEKYPKLVFLGLEAGGTAVQMEEIMGFFSKNPQTKNLLINCGLFSTNCEAFLKSTIKLEVLQIKFMPWSTAQKDRINKLLDDALELRKQQFYEKIAFIFNYCCIDNLMADRLALLNLSELQINEASWITDINGLAEKLVKLEKLTFGFAFCDDVVPFIRLSKNLTDITTKMLGEGEHLRGNILDLMGLSRKRSQIGLKLTFFVNENIYVGTKNGSRYIKNLLIQLQRVETKQQ